ncbi:hypothetical protein MAR_013125 [Mya arenaria]|uniref:Uncharacterized protein n=1 Tax=Mya arenaria TaxID=6604 RepID=A0ABY7G2Y9_MYAAR|nr:hypothetical protein MAR_013125 [Mya arenaria]
MPVCSTHIPCLMIVNHATQPAISTATTDKTWRQTRASAIVSGTRTRLLVATARTARLLPVRMGEHSTPLAAGVSVLLDSVDSTAVTRVLTKS